ncbi:MAG: N-6 DNA methylase [Phycisphaerales bacterium]|nr:N-6 DNA methylase [Phycisphaerales bacterium]
MAKRNHLNGDSALLIPELKTPKEAFRDLRNYLAGQHVGATRDDSLLEELLKCLFCKLYAEMGRTGELLADLEPFTLAKQVRGIFAKVRKDFPDLYTKDTEILLAPDAIAEVMRQCAFSLVDASTDPIGDAFEVFVGSESRGRAGQFFTPRPVTDLLVEAVDPKPGETIIDPACGAGGFLTSAARHFLDKGVKPSELGALVSNHLYGIDKDEYLTKLARLHVALLTTGHPRIHCADSVSLQNGSAHFRSELPAEGFDVLLTNPPFGVRIVAARPDVLRTFSLARKWRRDPETNRWVPTGELQSQVPPQVLFLERSLSLLKEGGRLGMVLPESILSNKSYRHVMEFLSDAAEVEAVIGMPDALFKTSGKGGTHTKTCLLVATKRTERVKRKPSIFMAEAKWCGHDSRARVIPHNDLPKIAANLKAYRAKRNLPASTLGFLVDRENIVDNVLCPRYYDPQIVIELASLERTHDLVRFGDLVKRGVLSIATGDELGKLAYGTGDIPFIRTSDISNWEIKADPKHGVDRRTFERIRSKQDVRAYDLLMVKDGTYLVGTCAIVTPNDRELIYQSHIYKIRVNDNEGLVDPFLLLAILSSPVVQRQIRSKQFTQDIIDSLGDRIHELVLPIPKDAKTRESVTEMVKTASRKRVEARELARDARLAVAGAG